MSMPSPELIANQAYPFKDATPKVISNEVLIEATLNDSSDSEAALETITQLRSSLKQINPAIRVGGVSAIQLPTHEQVPITTGQLLYQLY